MELKSISELVDHGYRKRKLYQIAHSIDFEEAGGIRDPKLGSKIYFDIIKLDRYLVNNTRRHL